jgi:hypothetical protein
VALEPEHFLLGQRSGHWHLFRKYIAKRRIFQGFEYEDAPAGAA